MRVYPQLQLTYVQGFTCVGINELRKLFSTMAIHIGTSGWSYDHWHGVLYPHGIPVHERLYYYLQHFHTSELNSSFYRWPSLYSFRSWQQKLPEGFRLSFKASRGLTHAKKLYAPELWVSRLSKAAAELKSKSGVVLVQLPPKLAYDYERLRYFLQQIPWWLKVTIEFRHPSWHQESIFQLLEQYQVAYCIMSGAYLPCVLRATASFVYVRLHGPDTHWLYGGSYADDDLRWWADRIREWEYSGKEVFVYFNNDGHGNAVRNAWTLKHFLQV
jgi:uncharacterized protein YecE (DUF72 family)